MSTAQAKPHVSIACTCFLCEAWRQQLVKPQVRLTLFDRKPSQNAMAWGYE